MVEADGVRSIERGSGVTRRGQYAYGVSLRRVGSNDILTRINITGKT
jgi:hypothetical protein